MSDRDNWNYGIPQKVVEAGILNTYGEITCPKCKSWREVTWNEYAGDAYCATCGVWVISGETK